MGVTLHRLEFLTSEVRVGHLRCDKWNASSRPHVISGPHYVRASAVLTSDSLKTFGVKALSFTTQSQRDTAQVRVAKVPLFQLACRVQDVRCCLAAQQLVREVASGCAASHVPTSSTLYPKPSTLKPKPSTLNPKPSTLNPQPQTLNPEPQTLNPQPSTHNPQPSTHNPRTTRPKSGR